MDAPPPSAIEAQASHAGLGRYIGRLTPCRSVSVCAAVLGATASAVGVVAASTRRDLPWPIVLLFVFLGLGGLLLLLVGLIELAPGPGQLYLFEAGFVHASKEGEIEVVPYGSTAEHAALRQRAEAMMAGRGRRFLGA